MNNSQLLGNTFGQPTSHLDNIFEEFLKQKESALSPIFLDDTIPNQNLNKSSNKLKLEQNNSKNLSISSDIKKSKKSLISSYGYGSNIIFVSSKQDDDSKENPVVTEFNKLMMNSQILS